jgi:RNA polymerase sigma-70 factor, ECF subfamily
MSRDQFDQIFREHYPQLVAVADAMLGDRQAAEDVAQDVMIEFWRRQEGLALDSVRGYLTKSTRNRALNHIRHNKVVGRVGPEDLALPATPQADRDTMEGELAAAVNKAMDKLPPRCREVFELSRAKGLKYGEIAEALGIAVKTVEAQMGKALKVLRDELSDHM